MRVHVINLDRSAERLATIADRLASLGVAMERFAAVDGRALGPEALARFASERPRANGAAWSAGQMGCLLSHLALWRAIADGPDRHAAILEDDVHVSPAIRAFVRDGAWIPQDADIVRLEVSTNRLLLSRTDRRDHAGREVRRLLSTAWCSGAYVIAARAARYLADLPVEHHEPVDRFLYCREESAAARRLAVYQVAPAVCAQDKLVDGPRRLDYVSEIETRPAGLRRPAPGRPRLLLAGTVRTLRGYRRVAFRE